MEQQPLAGNRCLLMEASKLPSGTCSLTFPWDKQVSARVGILVIADCLDPSGFLAKPAGSHAAQLESGRGRRSRKRWRFAVNGAPTSIENTD